MQQQKRISKYIRAHWGSLCLKAFGLYVFFLLAIGAVLIYLKGIPNPFNYETLTMFVLALWAVSFLEFWFARADEAKKKEDSQCKA
jgi:hypothetical protein